MNSSGAAYSGLPQCVCSKLPWWRALLSPKSEGERERGMEGRREGEREGGMEGRREGEREGGKEGGKEGGREEGRKSR